MRRLLEGPLQLDDHFVAVHRRVRAAHPYVLRNHPELILTPFALARKYRFETDAELDRLVEESLLLMDRNVRAHPIMRAAFLALLHDVDGAADALTDLRGRGVLQNFIPEFDAMLQLAPADPSHELTVGEHSIYAVRQLGDMWRRRNDDEFLFSVWDGVEDVELLVLTTLLHDVGKIQAGQRPLGSARVWAHHRRAHGRQLGAARPLVGINNAVTCCCARGASCATCRRRAPSAMCSNTSAM
jgi:[protein-PII] uridylyltransferase